MTRAVPVRRRGRAGAGPGVGGERSRRLPQGVPSGAGRSQPGPRRATTRDAFSRL